MRSCLSDLHVVRPSRSINFISVVEYTLLTKSSPFCLTRFLMTEFTNPKMDKSSSKRNTIDRHFVAEHLAQHHRGVYEYSDADQEIYFEAPIETILGYIFNDKDLLEEALESPGSSRRCVGDSHRNLGLNGNLAMANRGQAMMEGIIRADCEAMNITKYSMSNHLTLCSPCSETHISRGHPKGDRHSSWRQESPEARSGLGIAHLRS